MIEQVPPTDSDVRDLEILIRAHHPLLLIQTDEPQRAEVLAAWVADRLNLPFYTWSPRGGLARSDLPEFQVKGSQQPAVCLDFVIKNEAEALYFLPHFARHLQDDEIAERATSAAQQLFNTRSALVLPVQELDMPQPLQRVSTHVQLSAPTSAQYYHFIQLILRDLQRRMPLEVDLSSEEVSQLLNQLQGLTLFEVKKVLTRVIVEAGGFHARDIGKVAEAKRDIIAHSGVLEYFAPEESLEQVAGLIHLKEWLARRKLAFTQPNQALTFGLTPPKGLLLLGVAGSGKSLCAKAIAAEWQLPLIRLDPSNLYSKYFGESEKNLHRAITTAEAMAPIVLWIDELEKVLTQGKQDESGTGARIFGTFLTWLQDKKPGVFVVATSNDISRLPPELLRKGRFDEVFFVDLPNLAVRRAIFTLHLQRRHRDPLEFDVDALAKQSAGFSGSEIEQVVVSGLYAAFARGEQLSTTILEDEIDRTVPLSVTAAEKIAALRMWAQERAVFAD